MKILALGTANSARSQMTEGWLRALSTPEVLAYSAGTNPGVVSPDVVRVMAEVGVDLSAHRAKSVDAVPEPDVVVTVAPDAVCPDYPDSVQRISWPQDEPDTLDGLRRVRDTLAAEVDTWLRANGRRVEFGNRDAFALRTGMSFLNNGSFGATPKAVLTAQRRIQDEMEAQPVAFFRALPARIRRVAALMASFLRADPQDVAFVDNASSGVTAVLRSQRWQPGDVVYTTNHVYGAVRSALEHLKRTVGIEVVYGEVPFPLGSPDEVVQAVERTLPERARLAIFDHITSPTGLVFPVAALIARCRERSIPVLVDAAHVPGHLPFDLGALDPDYWVGNVHKWLYAPKGCAVLRVRPEHRERLEPVVFSHEIGKGLAASFDFQGTRDASPWLAAEASLTFVESMGGIDRIRAHNFGLRQAAASHLCAALGVEPPAPGEMLGAMATLPLPHSIDGTLANAVALNHRLWDEERVEVPFIPFGGRIWVRISAQLFNTMSDYEHLAAVLKKLRL